MVRVCCKAVTASLALVRGHIASHTVATTQLARAYLQLPSVRATSALIPAVFTCDRENPSHTAARKRLVRRGGPPRAPAAPAPAPHPAGGPGAQSLVRVARG